MSDVHTNNHETNPIPDNIADSLIDSLPNTSVAAATTTTTAALECPTKSKDLVRDVNVDSRLESYVVVPSVNDEGIIMTSKDDDDDAPPWIDIPTKDHNSNVNNINTLADSELPNENADSTDRNAMMCPDPTSARDSTTPRDIRLAMGPYAIVCTHHYLERRRVPDIHEKEQHGNTEDVSVTNPMVVVVTGSEPNDDDTRTASETYPIASRLPSMSFLPSSLEHKTTASSLPPMVEDDINTNHIIEATTATSKRISETKTQENEDDDDQIVDQPSDDTHNDDDDADRLVTILNRPSYVARTLVQVEAATRNWFLTEQSRVPSSPSPPDHPQYTTDFFPLQFNETSLSTIALWVAGGPQRKTCVPNHHHHHNNNNNNNNTTVYRPIVDTRFRNCSICHMFGHYEVECQKITPELSIQFSQAITNARNNHKNDDTDSKNTEQPLFATKHDVLFQKKYDITIEICDGYLIEQRSQEEALDERFHPTQPQHHATNHHRTNVGVVGDPNIVPTASSPSPSMTRIMAPPPIVEIDDFILHEAETLESLLKPEMSVNATTNASPTPKLTQTLARIQKGCLVTWNINTAEEDGTHNTDAAVTTSVMAIGTVVDMDTEMDQIQVHFLRIIEPINTMTRKRLLPSTMDPLVWVPIQSLYYVDGRNQLCPTDHIPTRKRRKYVKQKDLKKTLGDQRPQTTHTAAITTNATTTTKIKSKKKKYLVTHPKLPTKVKGGPSKRPRDTKRGRHMYNLFD